jgi:hypothetical protein
MTISLMITELSFIQSLTLGGGFLGPLAEDEQEQRWKGDDEESNATTQETTDTCPVCSRLQLSR